MSVSTTKRIAPTAEQLAYDAMLHAVASLDALFSDGRAADHRDGYYEVMDTCFADLTLEQLMGTYVTALHEHAAHRLSDVDLRHIAHVVTDATQRYPDCDSRRIAVFAALARQSQHDAVALATVISQSRAWSSNLTFTNALAEVPKCVYDALALGGPFNRQRYLQNRLNHERNEVLAAGSTPDQPYLFHDQFALAMTLATEWEGTLSELVETARQLVS
jgi:hypothetical protein